MYQIASAAAGSACSFYIWGRRPFFVPAKKQVLNKRFKIFLNYFLSPAVFVWLSFSIYYQVREQADVQQSWSVIKESFTGTHAWKIVVAVVLMALNQGLEAWKWKVIVKHVQTVSFLQAYSAVFLGQAFGFITPNRIGESVGRVIRLEEGRRLKGIALSVLSSISQIIITFLGALVALLFLRSHLVGRADFPGGPLVFWYNALLASAIAGTCLLLLLYFRLRQSIKQLVRIKVIARYHFLVEELQDFSWQELTRVLLLSAARYVIGMVQYVLLFQVFYVQLSIVDAVSLVAVVYLVMMIVPSITLAELGLRGKISLTLFGLLSRNSIGIIAVTAGIWIINLVLPAVIGSLMLLGAYLLRTKKNI